jgi:hypothetical protein
MSDVKYGVHNGNYTCEINNLAGMNHHFCIEMIGYKYLYIIFSRLLNENNFSQFVQDPLPCVQIFVVVVVVFGCQVVFLYYTTYIDSLVPGLVKPQVINRFYYVIAASVSPHNSTLTAKVYSFSAIPRKIHSILIVGFKI